MADTETLMKVVTHTAVEAERATITAMTEATKCIRTAAPSTGHTAVAKDQGQKQNRRTIPKAAYI